jgi:hypothetical protein
MVATSITERHTDDTYTGRFINITLSPLAIIVRYFLSLSKRHKHFIYIQSLSNHCPYAQSHNAMNMIPHAAETLNSETPFEAEDVARLVLAVVLESGRADVALVLTVTITCAVVVIVVTDVLGSLEVEEEPVVVVLEDDVGLVPTGLVDEVAGAAGGAVGGAAGAAVAVLPSTFTETFTLTETLSLLLSELLLLSLSTFVSVELELLLFVPLFESLLVLLLASLLLELELVSSLLSSSFEPTSLELEPTVPPLLLVDCVVVGVLPKFVLVGLFCVPAKSGETPPSLGSDDEPLKLEPEELPPISSTIGNSKNILEPLEPLLLPLADSIGPG